MPEQFLHGVEVAAMRAAVATLAADAGADFTADASWPDVPSEALAMIQQF